jgi:autotransporter-associated beta strand protein
MVRNKKKTLAGITLMSSISAVAHAGSVVIGNWEQTNDGWFDWPSDSTTTYSPPPTFPGGGEYSYSTTGATLGNYSLALNPGSGAYTQSLAIKLEYVNDSNGHSELQDFLSNTQFSIDETQNSAEWSSGSYAVTKLIINAPGIGFDDIGYPTSDTRNSGFPGGYTAANYPGISTGTLTWNYASLLPTIGANPGYVELIFYTVSDYSTVGNWYFDNARLTGPAVNSTWTNMQGDDLWTSGGNWSGGVPTSAGDTATFGTSIPGPTTISLNGNQTVGTMNFSDGASYTIAQGAGNGTLTLSNGTGSAIINDEFGNHTISAPVSIAAGGVTIAVGQANNTFAISGNISGAGGITLNGTNSALAVGTVALSGTNTYQGATVVDTGTLLLGATGALPSTTSLTIGTATATALVQLGTSTGAQTISGLTINAGSDLDVNNNHIFIKYANGTQATVDAAVRAYLIAGRNGGAWNGAGGIDSSAAALPANSHYALGYADGADHVVAGLSSGQIEIKYTLLGDADLDGSVTGSDFTALVGNLGKSGRVWDQGDFDYDGSVTGSDFTDLVGNLGKSASGADVVLPAADYAAIDAFAAANGLMADVPEPASAGMMIVAGLGIMSRRRRSSHCAKRSEPCDRP